MNNCITNNVELRDRALKALHDVLDPEIQLNVVDLGLIYQLDFDSEEKKLFCSMTLTTRFCPIGSSIKCDVEKSLCVEFPQMEIEVNLVFDPPWTSERISEAAKEFLNK